MIFDFMRNSVQPLLLQIQRHPFNSELAMGSLPMPKFLFYLSQDAIYLTEYAKSLAITAARLSDCRHVKEFMRFALEALEAESMLHRDFLHKHSMFKMTDTLQSPTCFMYTNYLSKMAYSASVEEAVASLLPCFWVYHEVGKKIAAFGQVNENPYLYWIMLYSSASFETSVNLAIEITNDLGAKASSALCKKMIGAFSRSMQLELRFWESAYQLENWNSHIVSADEN